MRARSTGLAAALSLALLIASPVGANASPAHWIPPRHLPWYWQLSGTVNNSYAVAAYDIDGFDNSATEVSALHATGKRAICYIDAGTWESWRPDAGSFSQSVLGSGNGWPGEKWLDVRQLSVLRPIMTARLEMCAQKGFDAVEPDNVDGYQNSTGFPLTAQDQLTYNEWIASEAHALGLAVFQKNDPDQSSALQPYFDGALDEQCNEYSECSSFQPYLAANKPVLNAEYSSSQYPGFCASDNSAGIMGALYSLSLDGSTYKPCFSLNSSTAPILPTGTPPPHPKPLSKPHALPGGRGPNVGIAVTALTDRRGTVAVRLTCLRGRSYCAGTVKLVVLKRGRHTVAVGRSRFRIASVRSKVVVIKLSSRPLGTVGHARAVRAAIEVSARDRGGRKGSSRRIVMLRLPRRR
jgi:hypothetical protein